MQEDNIRALTGIETHDHCYKTVAYVTFGLQLQAKQLNDQ